MHVHIQSANGAAKFWREPEISLARNEGIPHNELGKINRILKEREDVFKEAWRKHFTDRG